MTPQEIFQSRWWYLTGDGRLVQVKVTAIFWMDATLMMELAALADGDRRDIPDRMRVPFASLFQTATEARDTLITRHTDQLAAVDDIISSGDGGRA